MKSDKWQVTNKKTGALVIIYGTRHNARRLACKHFRIHWKLVVVEPAEEPIPYVCIDNRTAPGT